MTFKIFCSDYESPYGYLFDKDEIRKKLAEARQKLNPTAQQDKVPCDKSSSPPRNEVLSTSDLLETDDWRASLLQGKHVPKANNDEDMQADPDLWAEDNWRTWVLQGRKPPQSSHEADMVQDSDEGTQPSPQHTDTQGKEH